MRNVRTSAAALTVLVTTLGAATGTAQIIQRAPTNAESSPRAVQDTVQRALEDQAIDSQMRAAVRARSDGLGTAVAALDTLIASPRPAGLTRAETATWDEQTAWLRSVSDRYRPLGASYGNASLAASSVAELDLQFLTLQQAVQSESRKFQTLSNASKARHDVAMNAIRNLK
jgi:hypothetical protein